jgi:tetratricopeptide (TPR) repeat protein
MIKTDHMQPTPIDGITYYTPSPGFVITGLDGNVSIPWEFPTPLCDDDFRSLGAEDEPTYDHVGNGMYRALRNKPDCIYAIDYARVLKEGYPHIIAEIGGEAIMLDVKEVDTPYLDRKINLLRIMALLEPLNANIWREIARIYMEKGSRLEASHSAVHSWYAAEKYASHSLGLNPDDQHTKMHLAETHYILGHYQQAITLWSGILTTLDDTQKKRATERISAIETGKLPRVPVVDYLTALSVAFEQHQEGSFYEAAAIVEDVLLDEEFRVQFPLAGVYTFLEQCYRAVNMTDKADALKGCC